MINRSELIDKLIEWMQKLDYNLPDEAKVVERLVDYLLLLHKWNQAYNLTAVRSPTEMVSRHIIDSLAILPFIHGTRVLDVGSGAGLPGIPLAIANPKLEVVLLDSNGKKTRFLQEVKRALDLTQVEVVKSRVESYSPPKRFDTLVSRAFSSLQDMVALTNHLRSEEGIWLAMKGHRPDSELISLNYPFRVENYAISGVDGERCCVIIGDQYGKSDSHCQSKRRSGEDHNGD